GYSRAVRPRFRLFFGAPACRAASGPAHQPDDDQPRQRRADADQPERGLRRLDDAHHRPLGRPWERREDYAFNDEHQPKLRQKIPHGRPDLAQRAAAAGGAAPPDEADGAAAAGAAAAGAAGSLPEGELKKRKKLESGLSR